MKFIKHFTDAHRGKSMRLLLKKFGPAGIGRYWILVELCAEKMTKGKDEEFTEKHCVFEFERSYLSTSLGFGNLHQCSTYLAAMADLGLCSVEESADLCRCSMPKLLECLDRDTKRARKERGQAAPKNKNKNKKKDKEYTYAFFEDFERLAKKYQETFKGTAIGPALPRFKAQVADLTTVAEIELSIEHYRKVLKANEWRQPKTSFANYLGTERSGFFWRDYIKMPDLPVVPPSLDELKLHDYSQEGA